MASSNDYGIGGSDDPSPLKGEGGAKRRVRGSVSRARSLRRNETEAERLLWSILRGKRLGGHKFVRQFPIGPYVADFVCREAALVIELDGSQHLDSQRDVERTAFLNAEGYSVLRVWNSELLGNVRGVAEGILAAVNLHPSPGERYALATLSPEGRGTRGASAATTKQRSPRLTGALAHLKGSTLMAIVGDNLRITIAAALEETSEHVAPPSSALRAPSPIKGEGDGAQAPQVPSK